MVKKTCSSLKYFRADIIYQINVISPQRMFGSPKHNLFILITSYKVYCVIILCKIIASTLLVAGRALVKMATFKCELYKTNTLYRSPILTVIHVALVLVFFEYAIYFNIELCYKRRQQEIGYVN